MKNLGLTKITKALNENVKFGKKTEFKTYIFLIFAQTKTKKAEKIRFQK